MKSSTVIADVSYPQLVHRRLRQLQRQLVAGGVVLRGFGIVLIVTMTELDAVSLADLGEIRVQSFAIALAGVMTVSVRGRIARRELRKLLFYEREVALTRC